MIGKMHSLKALVLSFFVFVAMGWSAADAEWTTMTPGVLQSGWVCTHGHAGQIEFVSRIAGGTLEGVHTGSGLDFIENEYADNWIHYSIPVPVGHRVRHINIAAYFNSYNVFIWMVDVYDGKTKIQSLVTSGLFYGGGEIYNGITLSEDHVVETALGVSIRVVEDLIGPGPDQIVIYAVCADMFP